MRACNLGSVEVTQQSAEVPHQMAPRVIHLAIKTTQSGRHQVTIAQFYFSQEKCDTGPLFMDMAMAGRPRSLGPPMAMSINTGPVSPNHPYFFTAKLFSPRGALAGPMRILFLAPKMCHPQCRDEEGCAENHSSDHNSALETIQMPSFWEHTRLDVPHHDKASRDTV